MSGSSRKTGCAFSVPPFLRVRKQSALYLLLVAFVLVFFHPSAVLAQTAKSDHSLWDGLLKKYVEDGLVNYRDLQAERSVLDRYLGSLEDLDPETTDNFSREDWIAMLINLYNAKVVQTILLAMDGSDGAGKVDEGLIEKTPVQIAEETFSLGDVRDRILRKNFRDERVLTALVSGRMDSPKLRAEAYTSGMLDRQLDEAATVFTEDEHRNEIVPGKKRIYLSPVFRNYAGDFILNFSASDDESGLSPSERAVISFFLYHLKDAKKRLFLESGNYKIGYLPPDGRLNDAKSAVDRTPKS